MPLEEVLPRAEVVVLAEISTNDVTTVEKNPGKGPVSVVYTCKIKAEVLEEVKPGAPKELDLTTTFAVVKGVRLAWTGSGLEQNMKPNEKYVLLVTSRDGKLQLLRAEKAEELHTIKTLLKQLRNREPANRPDAGDGRAEPEEDPKPAPAVLHLAIRTKKPHTGLARVVLCQSSRAYDDKVAPARRAVVPLRKGRGTVAWKELPPGRYAIKVFFDANGNGKLDKGFLGRPVEPYGFSNDARGKKAPPSWDKASFEVGSGKSLSLTINLQ
jgi:uncharacterized protein (DUF2141 family)